jgi:hypothetical protein
MAVTTTSEAARAVASNVRARRIAAKEENDRAYEAYRRADTTTPLGNGTMMPTEQLPDPPAHIEEPAPIVEERAITLRTQISYRGRAIWIEARGLTLDSFCDMLDRRLEAQQ